MRPIHLIGLAAIVRSTHGGGFPRAAASLLLLACMLFGTSEGLGQEPAAKLTQAEQLYLKGRYAEAREMFQQASGERALYGEARCWQALGDATSAAGLLRGAIDEHAQWHQARTLLADLLMEQGEYPAVEELLAELRAAKHSSPHMDLLAAEHAYAVGKLEEAEAYYRSAAKEAQLPAGPLDLIACEQLLAAGQAMARLARWEGTQEPFRTLVQQYYPALVARRPEFWPAHLEMAKLFAEKFNTPATFVALNKALAGNASAGEIYLLRAEISNAEFDLPAGRRDIARTLAANAELRQGYALQADGLLAEFQFEEALAVLEKARKLHPLDERTLGRLAGAYRARDGAQLPAENAAAEGPSYWRQIEQQVLKLNPHCGVFYETMGRTLERMRKYPQAAEFYRQAAEVMPGRARVEAELGMLAMRLGEEAQAKQLLDEAFQRDPFNIRVKNTLEVLDVLQGYALLETDHFLLRFDRGQNAVMAEAAAEYLEEVVYPLLVKRLGYEPPQKSLIEIFSRARNSSGHAWFSARMVGLPFIGTVGACAGKMAAIVSPTDGRSFHWARVLRHEFVHVVNLQQTEFNIPHWYTEALAVWNEDRPRPAQWRSILAQRHAADEMFNLETINMGFIRPGNSDNWALAYCQAELYAEYMVQRFGDDALARMLTAYRENLTTEQAIEHCFSVKQPDFEQGYRAYVTRVVTQESPASETKQSVAELEQAVEATPNNATLQGQLALAHLSAGKLAAAKQAAAAGLKLEAHEPLATYVIAALLVKVDRAETAREFLAARLDLQAAEPHSLWLQATLAAQAEDWPVAEEAYRRGYDQLPTARNWLTGLEQVYQKTGDQAGLLWLLQQQAEQEDDDFALRQKIVTLADTLGEEAIAGRWAEDACYINPQSPQLWATAARWHALEGRHEKAARRWGWALHFNPTNDKWRLAMIESMLQNQRFEQAATALAPWAERMPTNAHVLRLQKEIDRGRVNNPQ